MHVPGHVMSTPVVTATTLAAAMGVSAAAIGAVCRDQRPAASRFAGVTALVFAGQMLNFPIAEGMSGHLVGGVLASALLGVPFGILSLSVVLILQCLLFGDGGVTTLGLNIFNMAVIGAGFGGLLYETLTHRRSGLGDRLSGLAIASWISVLAAAGACSLELMWSGVSPGGAVGRALLAAHALVGIGEGVIAVAMSVAVSRLGKPRRSWPVPFAAAGCAAVLSPWASPLPDAFERVSQQWGFASSAPAAFTAVWQDYAVPFLRHEALSTATAGLAGVLCVFAMAWLLMGVVELKKTKPAVMTNT